MSGRDYNKQVKRRQRIKKTTLVVGLDIGDEHNAMGLMSKDGEVLGRYPKIYNSRKGFEYFKKAIEVTKRKNGLKKVLIGMEPTGHYWRKIAYYSKDCGYEVRFVKTTALKHQRELDESSNAKNDMRDAVTIANIVREGKYIDTVIEDGALRELRMVGHLRENIQRKSSAAQNRLRAVLDDYFPELNKVFWSMKAKGLWMILEKCPFPEDVMEIKVSELTDMIAKGSRRKKKALEKAKKILELAKESVGLKYVGGADRYRVETCLEEIKRTENQLREIKGQMEILLKKIPSAEILMSIRGIGTISTAMFLGELGDPKCFDSAKAIIKYAGYDPIERDSGKNIGRKMISKKGRWALRKCLYFMGVRMIHQNKFFREYYEQKLEKKNRYGQLLKKKEALCAVIIKLIKVIFALLRDKRTFSVERPQLV